MKRDALYGRTVHGIAGVRQHGRSAETRYRFSRFRCKANTDTLTHEEDVLALFGYVGTPASMAALPLVQSAKVPFFAPVTGAEALRQPISRQVFHVRASYYDETALIVKQLTAVGLTRIAVFRQNDSYGQAGFDGVTRAPKARQLEPVAVGLVERNSVDVAAAVQAIVAANPQAVVQISTYRSCAAFVRKARKPGYGSTFYNVSFVGTQALADELGKDAAGVMVSRVLPFPYNATLAISRDADRRRTCEALNASAATGRRAMRASTSGTSQSGSGGWLTSTLPPTCRAERRTCN